MTSPAAAPTRGDPRTVRGSALSAALDSAREQRGRRLAELKSWLAIPSVSPDPARVDAVREAAAWLADWLRALGAQVQQLPTRGGPPVVIGRIDGPPGAPVVLVYGHYDVQPAGRGWTTDPFTPVVRAGVLYARGANDDKGQLFAHLAALDAWCRAGGIPVTVVIVAEGAEEVGSLGLPDVLQVLRRGIQADVVVVSDTERATPGRPAVTVSQRGQIAMTAVVDAGGPAAHPGRLGGALVDPSVVLAAALADLHLASRGWARRPGEAAGPHLLRLSDSEIRRAAGGRATAAADLHHRVTLGPALTVTALRAGDRTGASPGRALARLDIRLPPGTDPGPVLADVQHRLVRAAPPGVRVTLEGVSAHRGHEFVPGPRLRREIEAASHTGFGQPPAYLRSGGTIPAVGALAETFRTTPVLLGLGTPKGGAHGPDERMDLRGWARSVDTCIALMARIGGLAQEWRGRELRN
jgi:acetylornithine deacetylase/succinyl-diaminopimelate desuccinylase-like protein